MKKLLFALCVAGVGFLTSCNKDDDQVKPVIDTVSSIEKSMWMAEDQSRMEFIPELNEMLIYGQPSPMSDDEPPIPTAFTYYLQHDGTAKLNSYQITYNLNGHNLLLGDFRFSKIVRENTDVKNPMKGAKNKEWSKVVKGRYSVEFYKNGDSGVILSFIKSKALVIMRESECEPAEPRRFRFNEDKLYLGDPATEVGFHLEVYNTDKVILRPDDGTEDLMILHRLLH